MSKKLKGKINKILGCYEKSTVDPPSVLSPEYALKQNEREREKDKQVSRGLDSATNFFK